MFRLVSGGFKWFQDVSGGFRLLLVLVFVSAANECATMISTNNVTKTN